MYRRGMVDRQSGPERARATDGHFSGGLALAIGFDRLIGRLSDVRRSCRDDFLARQPDGFGELMCLAEEYLASLLQHAAVGNLTRHLALLRRWQRQPDPTRRQQAGMARTSVRRAILSFLPELIPDRALLRGVLLAWDDLLVQEHLAVSAGITRERTLLPPTVEFRPLLTPIPRGGPRPRVQALLQAALDAKVTYLSAGAGYGKTTELAHFLAISGRAHAWCTCRERQVAPMAWLSVLGQSILGVEPMRLPPFHQLRTALASSRSECVIVVDEVEQLAAGALGSLEELIAISSPTLKWVLVGRELRPIRWPEKSAPPTTAWLRAADLRLTESEAQQLGDGLHGEGGQRTLSSTALATIDGWAAAADLVWRRDPALSPDQGFPELDEFVQDRVLAPLQSGDRTMLERITWEDAGVQIQTRAESREALERLLALGYVVPSADGFRTLTPIAEALRRTTALHALSQHARPTPLKMPARRPLAGGSSNAPQLDVRLFGSLEVNRDGKTLLAPAWRKRKVRALLAILALRSTPVHRDVLLDLLWPDLDQTAGLNNLKYTVHHLRRALEPDLSVGGRSQYLSFVTENYSLRLEQNVRVDAPEFSRLIDLGSREHDAAAALRMLVAGSAYYVGPLLPEFPYEDWALRERERYQELWLSAQERIAVLYREMRRLDSALNVTLQALEVEKSRESLHRLAIECYLLKGDTTLALRQYHRAEAALRQDLGVSPSPRLKALLDRCSTLTA